MNARCVTPAILLPLSLVGCSKGGARWTGTMEDSAGVASVRNTEAAIWRPGEEWTLEEELRIGVVEGDDEYQFGAIVSRGIAVDSHGRIFVLDAQAQKIRVFSGRGEYLQTIGGPGGGPGEFARASVALMGPGDTLFVPDLRNRRMNRFSPDGSFVGSSRFPPEGGSSVAFKSNGSGVVAEQVSPLVYGRAWPDHPQDVIVTWTSDGPRSDTLAGFPSGQTWFVEGGAIHETWYAPEYCWEVTNDSRVLIGRNDDYRFGVFSPGHRLERIVTKAYEPRPVRSQDVDRVRSHLENRWKGMGASPTQVAQLWSEQHFNEFLPAFRTLDEGPAGTIWVQRVTPPSEVLEDEGLSFTWPSDWVVRGLEVFDSEERYLGVVTMPRRFTPSVFLGDRIYGVRLGESGVSYVMRLRVVGDIGDPSRAPQER